MYIVSCFSEWCPSRFQQFSLQKSCLNHLQKYGLAKSEPDMLAMAMQQTSIQSLGPVMSPMPHSLPTIAEEIRPEIPASQIGNFAPQPTEEESVIVLVEEEFEQKQPEVVLPTDGQGTGVYQYQVAPGTQGLCCSIDQTYTESVLCQPMVSQPLHVGTEIEPSPSSQIVLSPQSTDFSSGEVGSSQPSQVRVMSVETGGGGLSCMHVGDASDKISTS